MSSVVSEKQKRHEWHPPRVLRGHPRWAPTNDPNDIRCSYFIIPSVPKRSKARKRYNWMTERNSLNYNEDKLRLRKEMQYASSFLDCLRLKYMSVSKEQTVRRLIERYGPSEPSNTFVYENNHFWNESQFRKRPPSYFDNKEIPDWRYKQMKYESNVGLSAMEYEWVHIQKTQWKRYYHWCRIRRKIKKYIFDPKYKET